MEQHLAWNPNDNIGVRFIIGDACLMANMPRKAKEYLLEVQNDHPPALYTMALMEFKKQKYTDAATTCERLPEHYIAELLPAGKHSTPFYWHGTNLAGPETAIEYMENIGAEVWEKTDGAVDFCEWLLNHSAILKERAAIAEAQEGLFHEWDLNKREQYVGLETKAIASINKGLSKKIVKKFKDRSGEEKMAVAIRESINPFSFKIFMSFFKKVAWIFSNFIFFFDKAKNRKGWKIHPSGFCMKSERKTTNLEQINSSTDCFKNRYYFQNSKIECKFNQFTKIFLKIARAS